MMAAHSCCGSLRPVTLRRTARSKHVDGGRLVTAVTDWWDVSQAGRRDDGEASDGADTDDSGVDKKRSR